MPLHQSEEGKTGGGDHILSTTPAVVRLITNSTVVVGFSLNEALDCIQSWSIVRPESLRIDGFTLGIFREFF